MERRIDPIAPVTAFYAQERTTRIPRYFQCHMPERLRECLGNRPRFNQKIGDQLNWELVGILGGQAF